MAAQLCDRAQPRRPLLGDQGAQLIARVPTADGLQQRLIASLLREQGGTHRQWRLALGPIRVLNRETHPHCNWSVTPSGTSREIAAIERLLDTARLDYPLVADA